MDSVYQCDGIFLLSSGIYYFFTNVTGIFFTIVIKEIKEIKYHYDGKVFPVPKCFFTNVQGCQCTNVPRPRPTVAEWNKKEEATEFRVTQKEEEKCV